MQSRIILCTLNFIIYALPQGNTKSVHVDSSVEVGSNITSIVQKLSAYLAGLHMNNLLKGLTTPKPQVSEASNKFKEHILQLIKAMGNGPSTSPPMIHYQFQKTSPSVGIQDKKDAKETDIWDTLKAMFKYVTDALDDNKPSQAIVQEAEQEKEHSLLQNIKSGRVRGPVHVYGHHSGEDDY